MFSGIVVMIALIIVAIIFYLIGFRNGYKDCEKYIKKNLYVYNKFFNK